MIKTKTRGTARPEALSLGRRRAVRWLASALVVGVPATAALGADDYPARPVRIIVGYAAGGSTDSVARVVATALQERLKQPVVVDNRPGASTQIAGEAVMHSAADGYTLQMAASDLTILPSVRKRVPWSPLKDFTPIAQVATTGLVYTVRDKLPVKNLPEFVAYAKANPGKVTYGSGGNGSILHLVGELLRARAGADLVHIPYKGGAPIVQDLMSGQIDMGVLGPIDVASRADRVRAIAQTGPTRHPLLPNVPTTTEAGFPGATAVSMFTLVGPANLPKSVVDRLVRELEGAMGQQEFRDKIIAAGSVPALISGPALRDFLAEDMKNWQDVAKSSSISIDD